MTTSQTLAGRVRILAGDPPVVAGAGIQLTANHVLTCWHVVHDGHSTRRPLGVDVPAERQGPVAADMIWSADIGPDGGGDLAVLRTAAVLPSAPAALADHGDSDVDVRIVGYPPYSPAQVIARARATGPADAGTGWRQLDQISATTAAVSPGFSGAGAFDADGAVVGMVVAKATAGHGTVAWMLPVRHWHALLPASLRLPVLTRVTRAHAPSFDEKMALSRLLAQVPVLREPDSRQAVVSALPEHLRLAVPSYGRLGLDTFGLVRTVLEFHEGLADLHRVLLALEGPSSVPLQRFHDLAASLGLLPRAGEDR
ncbi:MAG TPA: trypsin-like peptidase domain-containing protein [Pilimelia sp.]|nr:trypsin-like peptidase domain-containing protein [Pilimelia sp.]